MISGKNKKSRTRLASIILIWLIVGASFISIFSPIAGTGNEERNSDPQDMDEINITQTNLQTTRTRSLADSPWPMFRGNLRHTGLSPYDTSANSGKMIWNFTTGSNVRSSPAIGSDGTIYVGSGDDKVYAINPNGTEKWSFLTGDNIVESSPAIGSDGTIYIGSDDDKLYAIYPDGTEKWNFTTGAEIWSSPAIGSDGTIYVGSFDYKLYAIFPNGTQKWNFTTGAEIGSSPAIGLDGTIYVGSCDKRVYAICPNGTEKWHFTTECSDTGIVSSSPAIGSDGTIYVGSHANTCPPKLYAINPDGSEKWNFPTGDDIHSSPAIGSDGTIYVNARDFKLYAINPNGTKKWICPFAPGLKGGVNDGSPVIGSDGTIYVGSGCDNDRNLYAIRPNGTKKWNFTTDWLIFASPAIGSDGTIYVGTCGRKLYAIGRNNPPTIITSDVTKADGERLYYVDYEAADPDNDLLTWHMKTNASWLTLNSVTGGLSGIPCTLDVGWYWVNISVDDGFDGVDWHNFKLTVLGGHYLKIEKSANTTIAEPGDYIEYTINFNNTPKNRTYKPIYDTHTQLTFENSIQKYPSFSPDGNKIVYSSFEDGGDYPDIWIMNADGSNHQQLTFENEFQTFPTFDPTGNKILYNSNEDGSGYLDIWIMNSDGSNHKQLTFEDSDQWFPRFNKNGSKIVYESSEDGGSYDDIWIMDYDGSNHQQLTFENVEQYYPSFNPDGNKIVYSSKEDGGSALNIWVMNVDGSYNQQLTFENDNQYYPNYSPDGKMIVYTSMEDYGIYCDIWIMVADGSNHQRLTNEDSDQLWPKFSSDGLKIIYYSTEDGDSYSDIWILNGTTIVGTFKKVYINDTFPFNITFITSSAEKYRTGEYNWIFDNVEPGEHSFSIDVKFDGGLPNGSTLTNYVHLDYIDAFNNQMPYSTDFVNVTVLNSSLKNQSPIADAGPDQNASINQTVYFDGSGSYDPDNDPIQYRWDFGDGTSTGWQNNCNSSHSYNNVGNYSVTLYVDDGELTDFDTCLILVNGSGGSSPASPLDSDEDGVPDYLDPNPFESPPRDTDNDGLSDDYETVFSGTDPNNYDTDSDGVDDKNDYFPLDPTKYLEPGVDDTDNDGIGDNKDAFPNDPAASIDTDKDGYPDEWNIDKSELNSTTGLKLDAFPNDSTEWVDTDGDGFGDNSDAYPNDPNRYKKDTTQDYLIEIILITLVIIILIFIISLKLFIQRSKRQRLSKTDFDEEMLNTVRHKILHSETLQEMEYSRAEIEGMLDRKFKAGQISVHTYNLIKKEVLCSDEAQLGQINNSKLRGKE